MIASILLEGIQRLRGDGDSFWLFPNLHKPYNAAQEELKIYMDSSSPPVMHQVFYSMLVSGLPAKRTRVWNGKWYSPSRLNVGRTLSNYPATDTKLDILYPQLSNSIKYIIYIYIYHYKIFLDVCVCTVGIPTQR